MSYYARIAAFSLAIWALIALLLVGARGAPITLVAQAPLGQEAPGSAAIRATFSRPVDRASAEAAFRLTPPAPGRFFWEDRTLTFQPDRPLDPATGYRAGFGPGLRDMEGRATTSELAWEFRTRGPQLLALRTTPSGGSAIWVVGLAGQAGRRLAEAPDGIGELAVAPDGARAIYTALQGTSRSALMLIDLDSGATRPLVDDPSASAAAPTWAVGDFIAFERRALSEGRLGAPQIWLAQPDGTLLGPLIGGAGAASSYAPAWSPDGNQIAYIDGVSQALMVYSFFTDVARALPVTTGERPAWLPDGAGLVYSGVGPGAAEPQLRLGLVTLGAAPAPQLLTDGAAAELGPAVAPSGAQVAFTRRAAAGPYAQIWLADLAGRAARPLSAAGAHQDTQPAWSPDGRLLAFVRASAAGPPQSLAVVVDPATGQETVVLDQVTQVVWLP